MKQSKNLLKSTGFYSEAFQKLRIRFFTPFVLDLDYEKHPRHG